MTNTTTQIINHKSIIINTSSPPNARHLLGRARRLHAHDFNLVAQHGKKPLAAWKSVPDWTTTRQTITDVLCLNWRKANGIALICGAISSDLRCVDFDKQPDRTAVDQFLAALGLPPNYSWLEQSPRGGWHVWVICHDLPTFDDQRGGKVDRDGRLGGHIEVRTEGVLSTIYLETIPDTPPATVSGEQLATAYEQVTVKPAPTDHQITEPLRRSDLHASRAGSWDQYLRDEFEPRIPSAWRNGTPNADGWYKNVSCPNPYHEDRDPSFGYNKISHTGNCFVCGKIDTDELADYIGAPRYVRHEPVQMFGPREANAAPEIHVQNTFPRYFPADLPESLVCSNDHFYGLGIHLNFWFKGIPNQGGLWAFIYAYNELCLAGDIDPEQGATVNQIISLAPRGLSKHTIRHAADQAIEVGLFEFFHFRSLKEADPILGTETGTIPGRGRPAPHVRMKPLDQGLAGYLSYLEKYAWRALLVADYPDLPVEALAFDDLLINQDGATYDDIAAIDDRSQTLYEQHADRLTAAAGELYYRMGRARAIMGIDAILRGSYTPLVIPEGVTFKNAAQFRDAIDEIDPQLSDGVREDRYKAARRTGRRLAAHRASCERRKEKIVMIPVWSDPVPVNADADLLPQVASIDQTAFNRGRMKLHAPDGEIIWLSAKAADSGKRDYSAWLEDHGGAEGAAVTIWERSIEKREMAMTEADHERVKDIREHQEDISRKRSKERDPRPDPMRDWYVRQGELRVEVFDLQPIPQHEPKIYIDPRRQVFEAGDVWQGIITQVKEREEIEMPTLTTYSHIPHFQKANRNKSDFGSNRCGKWVVDYPVRLPCAAIRDLIAAALRSNPSDSPYRYAGSRSPRRR